MNVDLATRTLILLLLGVLISACSEEPSKEDRARRRAEREAKAAEFAAQPPKLIRHDLTDGQLLILDIPINQDGLKERQTCFVWRDEKLNSATFTCPSRN